MELPEPGLPDVCQQLMFHGLGYLSATDEYRVFATAYGGFRDEYSFSYDQAEEMKMFSSRSRVWKEIKHPGHHAHHPNQGTLLNETLHNWYSWMEDLLAFNFAKEEFSTMRLPEEFELQPAPSGVISVVDFCCLGATDGCLCACDYFHGDDSVDFWIMREYGVEDSWTKLFSFSRDLPRQYEDFLIMERCTVAVNGPD